MDSEKSITFVIEIITTTKTLTTMAIKLSTNNGDFVLKSSYDLETGQSFYDVYLPVSEGECGYGEWQGEYFPYFDIDEEYDEFVNHFEVWLDANDIVNLG